MSDLVERARKFAKWGLYGGEPVDRSDFTAWADRIEELERERAHAEEQYKIVLDSYAAENQRFHDRIEELERFAGFALDERNTAFAIREQARAVLEKGKQPSAAESGGEEIENVAIVTRTVKAGQGRVEGEP
jgi:predicted nuclease with TOPRIM domain